ncbi:MAG: transaldolase [Merismopedia sp. SIO2A8]|nr:transaldolase [Symploca sp. SIO2B6]NET49936.1 transaldolase [Merismopedia sp. SIO2A8]
MRFFLDTADVSAWETWLPTGLFYGVTSNPLLLERAGQACTIPHLQTLMALALKYGTQEVQVQTWGPTVETLVENGLALSTTAQNVLGPHTTARVVIKVPITKMGIQAATQLLKKGIPITLTAVYLPQQVAIAAALQVDYAAPYLGRICDQGADGHQLLTTMHHILQRTHSSTRLLVASIRSISDIVTLAAEGLDTFTISPAIATALFQVDATLTATADFERAAAVMSGDG